MLLAPVAGEALLLISVPQKQLLQIKGSFVCRLPKRSCAEVSFFSIWMLIIWIAKVYMNKPLQLKFFFCKNLCDKIQ